ncbi:MAG: hypothetical protein ACJ761_05610 [Chloroflexota bacterium]
MSLLVGLALLAFVVRLVPVLRGGGLVGMIDHDDGVYFGSAVALVHGRIAYRDFLLLHPPGILYLLSPFAALGYLVGDANALAIMRVVFMLLGAVNTVLVTLVAGRGGRLAGLSAGALYAVWVVPANVERTSWLIGPQSTLLLLALLLLGRGGEPRALGSTRLVAVGGLIGLAVGIQLWGVVPFAVVLGWLVIGLRGLSWRASTGRVVAYSVSAAIAAGAVVLPFLLTAGPVMLRYIVVDQVGRFARTNTPPINRLRALEGLPMTGTWAGLVPPVAVVLGFVMAGAVVAWIAWQRPHARLWVALLAGQTGFLLLGPVFFNHYAGWIAPAAALSIGTAADAALRPSGEGHRRTAVAAAVYATALAVLLAGNVTRAAGTRLPLAALTADLAAARCVAADSPVLLVVTGTLRRVLDSGCALKLDPAGTSNDTDSGVTGRARTRRNQPEYQQAMEAYYGNSDAALFARLTEGDGFTAKTWADIRRALPVTRMYGRITVLLRSGP